MIKKIKSILLLLSIMYIPVIYADVAVVINKHNALSVNESDISRLFLGKMKSFDSGENAKPVNLKFGNSIRKEFEQKVLNKSSQQVKAYWSKLIFSGRGKPPKEVTSDSEVIKFILENEGAIGYIDATNVTDDLKVIKVF